MNQINSNPRNSITPAWGLYSAHKENILSTRSILFETIYKKSPRLGDGVKKIFNNKLAETKESPLMFELFPWIIGDIINAKTDITKSIAVNWLALYLYITFIDDHLDLDTKIQPDEFLGASILAQKGLINLFKIVHGTKYEQLFDEAVFSSANYELSDVIGQNNIHSLSEKIESSNGKNHVLIACAAALVASVQGNSDFVITITQKLLLAIQYFDDIADFEDDWKNNNITVLLSGIVNVEKIPYSKNDLLTELVKNGSLLNIIKTIEESLDASLILIKAHSDEINYNNASTEFFTQMYFAVIELSDKLSLPCPFDTLGEKEQAQIIQEVEKNIYKIYMHT